MLRIGLIGCGRISARHAATIAGRGDVELAAVHDADPARMRGWIERYAERSPDRTPPVPYEEAAKLLGDPAIAGVVLAVPSWLHAEYALAALRAGKHVMLEKPMALSLQDADAICELAQSTGLAVQVCHPLRYRPLMREIRRLVDEGRLGKLLMGSVGMRLNRNDKYYAEAGWRGTWALDGGMLLNQGVHLIDLLLWWMGGIDEAFGRLARVSPAKETEDAAVGAIRFASGAIGSIEADTIAQPDNYDNEIALFGERGTVIVGGIGLRHVRRWTADGGVGAPPPENADADEHASMYAHWIARMKGERGELIEPADARRSLEAIFALYESARLGTAVRMPLPAFDTRSMASIFRT